MTPIEAPTLEREDLQPVPQSFPNSFKVTIKDRARFNEKPIRFNFPNFLKGEGTLHISEPGAKGNSLAMIMATNSFPDVATVYHFYLSQDKFDRIVSTPTGFELNL
jgi:hypothetical protein